MYILASANPLDKCQIQSIPHAPQGDVGHTPPARLFRNKNPRLPNKNTDLPITNRSTGAEARYLGTWRTLTTCRDASMHPKSDTANDVHVILPPDVDPGRLSDDGHALLELLDQLTGPTLAFTDIQFQL